MMNWVKGQWYQSVYYKNNYWKFSYIDDSLEHTRIYFSECIFHKEYTEKIDYISNEQMYETVIVCKFEDIKHLLPKDYIFDEPIINENYDNLIEILNKLNIK